MVSGLPYKQSHRTYPLLLPADYSFAHSSLRENLEVQMLGGGPKRDKNRWRQNRLALGLKIACVNMKFAQHLGKK